MSAPSVNYERAFIFQFSFLKTSGGLDYTVGHHWTGDDWNTKFCSSAVSPRHTIFKLTLHFLDVFMSLIFYSPVITVSSV